MKSRTVRRLFEYEAFRLSFRFLRSQGSVSTRSVSLRNQTRLRSKPDRVSTSEFDPSQTGNFASVSDSNLDSSQLDRLSFEPRFQRPTYRSSSPRLRLEPDSSSVPER